MLTLHGFCGSNSLSGEDVLARQYPGSPRTSMSRWRWLGQDAALPWLIRMRSDAASQLCRSPSSERGAAGHGDGVEESSAWGRQAGCSGSWREGETPHLFQLIEAPFLLREELELEEPLELLEPLLFCISPMLGQVVAQAGERASTITVLRVEAALEGGGVYRREIRPAVPTYRGNRRRAKWARQSASTKKRLPG